MEAMKFYGGGVGYPQKYGEWEVIEPLGEGGQSTVPAALQHTWSGHAKSHVSEVYKKLLKQREWRLRRAEKTGTGFTLPGHQQATAEASNGKPGKLLQFRKIGYWWTRWDSNPRP